MNPNHCPNEAADGGNGELPENLLDGLDFLDEEEDTVAGPHADLMGPAAGLAGTLSSDDGGGKQSGTSTGTTRSTRNDEAAASHASGAPAAHAPSSSTTQEQQQQQQQQFIPSSEIGPHDVLLGRGQRSYDARGTVLFRRLVAERKEEYLTATKIKRKKEIAGELVDHVRNRLDPPGRFLRLVTEAERGGLLLQATEQQQGGLAELLEDGSDEQLWCLADDKQCLEKAKMTLRQKEAKVDSKKDSSAASVQVAKGFSKSVGKSATRGKKAGAKGSGKSKRGRNWPGSDALSSVMSTSSHGSSMTATAPAKSLDSRATSTSTSLFVASPTGTSLHHQQQISQQYSMTPNNPAHLVPSSSSPSTIHDRKRLDQMAKMQSSLALASQFRRSGGTDLAMLGSILFQNLAGFGPGEMGLKGVGAAENSNGHSAAGDPAEALGGDDDDDGVRPNRHHPRQQRDIYSFLLDLDVPPSLCDVVASLLDPGTSDRIQYIAAVQVEQDIQLLVETPGQYLSSSDFGDDVGGRLDLPADGGDIKRLYGRDGQLSFLAHTLERALLRRESGAPVAALFGGTVREIIALSGYSGTGKSSLVDQMRRPIASMGGAFVSGKFDDAGHVNPLSVIFASFDEFCGDLLHNGSDWATSLKVDMINGLHGQGDVSSLASTLPNLGTILASAPLKYSANTIYNPEVGGMEALNRFIFHFRCFVRALATPNHPLLLVLDDCQWIDSAALEFLNSTLLSSDDEMSSILVVLAFRDNEVGIDHPLKVELDKMPSLGVNVNSIELQNLDRNEVTAFVADSLHMLPRQVFPLASSILSKTDGNPLFVIQFIKSLVDEQILQYSVSARRWKWDLSTIQSKELADNVVGLMVKKMLSLDMKAQMLLKFLACLGHRTDECIVNLFLAIVGAECLREIVEEGLITRIEGASTSYKFAHDKVQQAAYSLIPSGDRVTTHLHVGRLLRDKVTQTLKASTSASDQEHNVIIFAAVDQLSRGAELITIGDEKVEFARLCCIAGERALAISAFNTAAIYLLQGSAMLDETDWSTNYELILNLFTKCAHAQYLTGNHQGVQITLDPVLKNGRSLEDKFDAYLIVLNTLGAQGKQKDTLSFGLDFLANLGENFPRDPQREDVMAEFGRIKEVLAGTSIDDIKNAPTMVDEEKIATMKIFVTMNRYAFQANQNLMSLIIFRAGYEYAKLGLALLDRYHNKEYCARVSCVAYGLVFPSAEPFQANIQKLKDGYEEGMQAGDVEWSMILSDLYARTALLCGGGDLLPLAEEIRKRTRRMKELSHHMQTMTLPCLQAALNLIDPSVECPNVLSGEAMDEDALLNKALENQRLNVLAIVYFLKLWLSYLFGEYEEAAEMARKCQRIRKSRPFRGGNEAIETFYTGLVAAEMVRREQQQNQRELWRSVAAESTKAMENWASLCPWNFSGKLSLMQAEISFTDGNASAAAEAYRASIELAKQHRFVHEEALANERAGMFFASTCGTTSDANTDADAAERHYLRAQTLYAAIGAARKAKHIEAVVSSLGC